MAQLLNAKKSAKAVSGDLSLYENRMSYVRHFVSRRLSVWRTSFLLCTSDLAIYSTADVRLETFTRHIA